MQKPIRRLSDYLRMIKFSHSLFALPFAGVALVQLLYYDPSVLERSDFLKLLAGIVICMVAMRSAAMGFNRIVDRRFDAANPRTANREIPSGTISLSSAVFFVMLFLAIFVAAAFWIQPLCRMAFAHTDHRHARIFVYKALYLPLPSRTRPCSWPCSSGRLGRRSGNNHD